MSWQPACRSRPGSYYPAIPNSTDEDQSAGKKCGESTLRRLACCAVSASAELLVYSTRPVMGQCSLFSSLVSSRTVSTTSSRGSRLGWWLKRLATNARFSFSLPLTTSDGVTNARQPSLSACCSISSARDVRFRSCIDHQVQV